MKSIRTIVLLFLWAASASAKGNAPIYALADEIWGRIRDNGSPVSRFFNSTSGVLPMVFSTLPSRGMSRLERDDGGERSTRVSIVLATLRAMKNSPEQAARNLIWIDCEMTGLDLEKDVLVEIAVLVTDSELNVIGDGIDLVIAATPEQIAGMNDFVTQMHTNSGLITEIPNGIALSAAEDLIIKYLESASTVAGKSPLAGNSVSVDRSFIARDMPRLNEYLHYRTIDVSSIKELARRWYPKTYFAAPAKTGNPRALGDIRDSIDELKYYKTSVFAENTPTKKAKNNRFLNFGPWRVK